jgi:hypothetical protein
MLLLSSLRKLSNLSIESSSLLSTAVLSSLGHISSITELQLFGESERGLRLGALSALPRLRSLACKVLCVELATAEMMCTVSSLTALTSLMVSTVGVLQYWTECVALWLWQLCWGCRCVLTLEGTRQDRSRCTLSSQGAGALASKPHSKQVCSRTAECISVLQNVRGCSAGDGMCSAICKGPDLVALASWRWQR